MAKPNNVTEDQGKFEVFKTERKKARTPAIQSGYLNYIYPTTKDKIQALAYSSCYDDDEETRESLFGEINHIYGFDPWNVILYLQSIATDLNDLFIRACKNLIDALKPKPKPKYDYEFATASAHCEYDNEKFENGSNVKKFPNNKRFKKYDLSYTKDKKSQSEYDKSFNERVYASERGKPQHEATQKAETARTTESNRLAAMSMAGEGSSGGNLTWDTSGGDHYTSCDPDYAMFAMDF